MADGLTHARLTRSVGTVLAITAGVVALSGHPLAGLGVICGAIAGHLMTPDLDLSGLTYEEARVYRFGWLPGTLWRLYWMPYSILPHRSIWSHLPGLSTAIRLAYAFWWLPVLWTWQGWALEPLGMVGLWTWAAASVQDMTHFALDGFRLF